MLQAQIRYGLSFSRQAGDPSDVADPPAEQPLSFLPSRSRACNSHLQVHLQTFSAIASNSLQLR